MAEKKGEEPDDLAAGPLGRSSRSGITSSPSPVIRSGKDTISAELALTIFRQMVRTRALEMRSIKMSKSGEAFFWIGGPGEEAVNVCLGMQVRRGQGPAHDYLHLHYRSSGTLLAMGMPMVDHTRQLAMTATDPFSRGRNFVGHYAIPAWNIPPVSSVIECQLVTAIGSAHVQKRYGGEGITIAVSGDAGTAEGDFESSLLWSSRPGNELPLLVLVTNNGAGISTPHLSQHGVARISDRGIPYGMRTETVDGNDPVVAWHAIDRAMRYVRRERKPFLLETIVGRLHGHSSSSGAQRDWSQVDCMSFFEQKLVDAGALDAESIAAMKLEAQEEADAAAFQAVSEEKPTRNDLYRDVYAPSEVDAVYPGDYTGLPRRR